MDTTAAPATTQRRLHRMLTWRTLAMLTCTAAGAILLAIATVQLSYARRIEAPATARVAPVAIVLGASVKPDGTPSDALYDRIRTGVDLYKAGRVERILMTGDDGRFHINEVEAMKRTAIEDGVPEDAILVDGQGYRTYESCTRAHDTLNITKAIVVTQRFHLGRALFLCNTLGIDATGVAADRQTYVKGTQFWVRDLLSSAKAFWDVYVWKPSPPVQPSSDSAT